MDIGDLLRNKRIEKGLTQRDIAEKVGVSEGTVSRWESGKIGNMRRDRIQALANVLSIDPLIITRSNDSFDDTTAKIGTGTAVGITAAGISAAGALGGACAFSGTTIGALAGPVGAAVAGILAAAGALSDAVKKSEEISEDKNIDIGFSIIKDPAERRMIESYRTLSDTNKQLITSMIDSLTAKSDSEKAETESPS